MGFESWEEGHAGTEFEEWVEGGIEGRGIAEDDERQLPPPEGFQGVDIVLEHVVGVAEAGE